MPYLILTYAASYAMPSTGMRSVLRTSHAMPGTKPHVPSLPPSLCFSSARCQELFERVLDGFDHVLKVAREKKARSRALSAYPRSSTAWIVPIPSYALAQHRAIPASSDVRY